MQNSETTTDLGSDTSGATARNSTENYVSIKLILRIIRFSSVILGICIISLILCGYMINNYSKEIIYIQEKQLENSDERIEAYERALAASAALVKTQKDQIANKDNLISLLEAKTEIQERLINSLQKGGDE